MSIGIKNKNSASTKDLNTDLKSSSLLKKKAADKMNSVRIVNFSRKKTTVVK
jgi:hypothetical protein